MKKITNTTLFYTAAFYLISISAYSCLMCSCAVSKTIYHGGDNYNHAVTPRFSENTAAGENINGIFPEAVYIKTRTQTFNLYHYYIVLEGRIWYKSIDADKEPAGWTLFEKTGLPHNTPNWEFTKTGAVAEISADADELVALSVEGAFYRYCFDKTIAHKSNMWLDRQGWPAEEQLRLDPRTEKNLSWALGKRNAHVLYYEDPFGNQHHNGAMEIATTYMLLEGGQEICYADPGVPSDFSRNYTGPERGAFKALSLSASASTMFVINDAGEMYTRLADFDTIGCDPMWFKYTYIPYRSNLAGTDYFSNLNEWGLPAEDWRRQPRIPLAGKAAITRHITIFQNGQGNGARELRVAGLNGDGAAGYWFKTIFAETWDFKTVPLYFSDNSILKKEDGAIGGRGISFDKYYSGYKWNGVEKENEWEYTIPNFNILEGSCDFRVTFQGETCVLKLHPVEMWTHLKRDYIPGRIGPPKIFFVTLEIPPDAFTGLSKDFIRRIHEKFAKSNKALFKYCMVASSRFLIMRDTGEVSTEWPESALFLTDGTISDYLPGFRRSWYIAGSEELRRYAASELVFAASSAVPRERYDELYRKIELNKMFMAEIKGSIAALQSDKAAAVTLDMVYIPLHYIARLTPLRFIDAPKIRTMTSYGEKIVLTNSVYITIVSDTWIWIYQKIIKLLEVRILCYEEMAKQLAAGAAVVSIPAWYAQTITEYWDIAGLPHNINGNFITAAGEEIPASLQFYTGAETGSLLGWYFSINNNHTFTFFIDPKNSAGAIYSRHGKTPEQKKLKINGTLYINYGGTTELEQQIIENSIKRFRRIEHEGIDVSISFNKNIFEIHESPPRHGRTLIFRGNNFMENSGRDNETK